MINKSSSNYSRKSFSRGSNRVAVAVVVAVALVVVVVMREIYCYRRLSYALTRI